jgi:acid phosphatase (class A)
MLAFFVLCVPATAFESNLVTREQVDAVKLLPPPPAIGSLAQQRDMQADIQAEKDRTPEQAAKAVADNEISVFRFADILGPHFTAAELPITSKFFQQVIELQRVILIPTKDVWNRPRPFITNPDLHPVGELPTNGSYPSGHSHFGYLSGILLGQMVPEKAAELMVRAVEYDDNRVLAGVHYPTDVEASRRVAAATAVVLLANPIFRSELATVKAELRRGLGFPE